MAKQKLSARAKFIAEVDLKKLAGTTWDALMLASTHDPDLEMRIDVLERQMERIGAPQYRLIKKGKRR